MGTKTDKSTEKSPLSADIIELKDLYELMLVEGIDVLELKNDDRHIKLSRQMPVTSMPQPGSYSRPASVGAPALAKAAASAPTGESINAPLAGVFYRASSPSTPAFVKEGDSVEAGQTLCIVEAMKVMNEIKAEKRCRITKIGAENSRPVSVGQPLFWIE